MRGRLLRWLGLADDAGGEGTATDDLDWTDPGTEYGGDGPPRRYTCPECGATIEGVGPDRQLTCPDCATAFKGVLTPDFAVCPDCSARIDDFELYPETRRDTEFASCSACPYRWESDPR
jgi:DNA-directed RNA polymerase subunit RPC12/RpoP